ncbi:anticodon-binding domain-containing protein [Zopfochytrium polystomum]|nr:anticodon-binding domain-containing protein [Zopfochytrium polystomum]
MATLPFTPSDAVGQHVRVTLINDSTRDGFIYAYDPSVGLLALQSAPVPAPSSHSSSSSAVSSSNATKPNGSQPQQPPTSHSSSHTAASASNLHDFHLLKVAAIKDVKRLAVPPGLSAADADADAAAAATASSATGSSWADDVDDSSPTAAAPPTPAASAGAAAAAAAHAATRARPGLLVPVRSVNVDKVQAREKAAVRGEMERLAKIGVGVSELAQEIFYALDKTLPTRWKGKSIIVLDEVEISEPYTADTVVGPNPPAVSRVKMVLELERKRLVAAKGGRVMDANATRERERRNL